MDVEQVREFFLNEIYHSIARLCFLKTIDNEYGEFGFIVNAIKGTLDSWIPIKKKYYFIMTRLEIHQQRTSPILQSLLLSIELCSNSASHLARFLE